MENNLALKKETLKWLSDVVLVAGFVSIAVSLISWFSKGSGDRGHAERLAIFIGLWVPSLFALSHRLARAAEERGWDALDEQMGVRKLASDFFTEVSDLPERS